MLELNPARICRSDHDLRLSPWTVEICRANVMTRVQAGSLSELVRMALVTGVAPAG